ncbi:MAG: PSD1 and planctomycete cytochrome C domain-containing protein [Acidobacteriota bacterium]
MILRTLAAALPFLALTAILSPAQTPAQIELFEKNARPLFAEKCQGCHNAKLKSGGLDFSSPEAVKEAAASGIFGKPAEPEKSALIRALSYENQIKMPPQGKLPAEMIASVRDWVAAGAPLPPTTPSAGNALSGTGVRPVSLRGVITDADKNFWSFKPLSHDPPPANRQKDWATGPLDQFILANLEKNGLKPAPQADKGTLLRRVTFDLIGLPPTEKELQDFLADKSPKAYEKVVDRLLASPRYGERWGRHWLDAMRYADSTGSDEDHRYPHAWRYRDYVIQAFNDDMPYNQFVREQLAGDVLAADPNSGVGYRGIIATGFLALGKKALAQKDLPLKRYDVVDDQIDVTAKAFLGLTVTCARCHDHKFDPIATRDYYQMAAIFASTLSYEKGETGDPIQTPLAPAGQFEAFKKQWTEYLGVQRSVMKIYDFDREAKKDRDAQEKQIPAFMQAAYRVYGKHEPLAAVATDTKLDEKALGRWVDYLKAETHPELAKWRAATDANRQEIAAGYQEDFRRSAYQYDQDLSWWKQAEQSFPSAGKIAGPRPVMDKDKDPFFAAILSENGPLYRSKEERIDSLTPEKAAQVRTLLAQSAELAKKLPTEEVPMACAVKEGETMDQKIFVRGDYHNLGDKVAPTVPSILALNAPAPPVSTKSGRLELADWIVDPRNPIPSRVMMNRIWQGHFGDGIVRTPDNFGRLGERPSNPELLDYLARTFIENGWSIKKMNRLIVLSKTYQMSAVSDEEKKSKDPEDRLISHFPPQRLSIEEIRDAYLAMGGNLDLKMGGTLDPGVGTDGETSASRISMNPESTNRRSIYLPLRRSNLPTLYSLFDFGDATSPEGKRSSTTVATQALFVMNSPMVIREAKALTDTVLKQEKQDRRRLEELYIRILDRHPDPDEIDKGLTYVQSLHRKWNEIDEEKAWTSLCHALMASNEFIYVY